MGLFSQISDVPPGGTWQSARTKINSNFATALDSLTAHHLRILSNTQAHTLNYNGILSLIDSTAKYRGIIEQLQSDVTALESGSTAFDSTFVYLKITGVADTARTAFSWGNHASGGYVTGTPWTAVGYLTEVDLSDINTTGTASSSNFLRGDGAWATPEGSGGLTAEQVGTQIADSLNALEAGAQTLAAGTNVTLRESGDSIYIDATGGGTEGVTLNGGSLTLSGGDSLTFVTQTDASYILPSGGGTLMLMSEIQDMLRDTIAKRDTRIGELEDLVNELLANLENIGIDLQSPAFHSAQVRNDTLWITLNGGDINQGIIPDMDEFELTEDSEVFGLTSIALSDSLLTFKLDSTTVYGSTYLVSYTQPEMAALQDSTGNKMASFSGRSVTNSNVEPEEPDYSYDMLLTSTGSGVSTFRVAVSENTTFTLTGDARFYSNSAGDADESTTWEATTGGDRIRYIRLATGTANLSIPDVRFITKLGSGAGGFSDGSGGPYPTIDLTNFVNLTYIYFAAFATDAVVGGDLTGLTSLESVYLNLTSSVEGDISDHPNFNAVFLVSTGNAIEGDIGTSSIGTGGGLNIASGAGTLSYTAGKNWANAVQVIANSSPFLARADVINMWLDMDASSPSITSQALILFSTPTLSDTSQGGIWGNFSGTATPSPLAIAIKSLAVTKGNTLTLSHAGLVALPGGTGDGTGFPAGFGDWWRE